MLHALVCFTLSVAVLGQTTSTRTPAQSVVKIAAAAPKEVIAAPGVWVATWSSVPAGLRYVSPMVWLRDERSGFETFGVSGTQPLGIARVALELKALPKGRRSMHLWYYRDGILSQPSDRVSLVSGSMRSPWPTTAEAAVKSQWTTALNGLATAGAKPDYIFLDNEEAGMLSNWHLSPTQITAFMNDPRFNDALLMSHASSLGVSTQSPTGSTFSGPQTGKGYLAWNLVIHEMVNEAITRALWNPAKFKFPELKGSAYQGTNITAQHAIQDLNGHAQPSNNRFGTSSAPALYGWLNGAALHCSIDPNDHTKLLLGAGGTPIGRSAWMAFLLDVQMGRGVRRSDAEPMHPWILAPSWRGEPVGTACYSTDPRYYDEMLRHLALLKTEVFQLWNPADIVNGAETLISRDRRFNEARALEIVISDINRKLQGRLAEPIDASRLAWDARIIATGTKLAANSYLWRVTAKPEVRSFQIGSGGPIITIPVGAVGVWITSARADLPTLRPIGGETTAIAAVGRQ